MAPFNRYHTFDVVRGVAEAGRAGQIALYTGNDDNIVADLLTPFTVSVGGRPSRSHRGRPARALGRVDQAGGRATGRDPSGHRREPAHPARVAHPRRRDHRRQRRFFDVANGFAGCIAGLHEVLRRQGLLEGTWCLDPHESLSPGQADEIDRVYRAYPHLHDDAFVREHLDEWLS